LLRNIIVVVNSVCLFVIFSNYLFFAIPPHAHNTLSQNWVGAAFDASFLLTLKATNCHGQGNPPVLTSKAPAESLETFLNDAFDREEDEDGGQEEEDVHSAIEAGAQEANSPPPAEIAKAADGEKKRERFTLKVCLLRGGW